MRTLPILIRRATLLSVAMALSILATGRMVSAKRPRDDLDRLVLQELAKRRIPGLSLAIVRNGRIVDTRAYGTTEINGGRPVTPSTLFQAASISKPVSALGALHLVEEGKLSLDEPVNRKLKSWKVPENDFTRAQPVTLRRLLSHTAGINVGGIPGHAATQPYPTLVESLSGKGNTPAIEVTLLPGSAFRYAGGGYGVMQLLVQDITGVPFAEYMRRTVLEPLGMTSSTFAIPLPASMAADAPTGYRLDRSQATDRWRNYVETAAAGLWTTPTDLARYIIGVSDALAGRSSIISAKTAREMFTVEKANYGKGPAVEVVDGTVRFYHGGRNAGFDSFITGYPATGDGAVVMINANDDERLPMRVMSAIAKLHGWPSYPPDRP